MVVQHHLGSPAASEQTLATLWRRHASRVSERTIVTCLALGTLGTIVPLFFPGWAIVSSVSLIVVAFGVYAATAHPNLGGRRLGPGAQRIVGAVASTIAAMSGLVAGLLLLGAVFGGSIEVMRR